MEPTEKQRGNAKGPTSYVVAANIRTIRQSRGLDLAGLSSKLTDGGWPIPVAALSRLENGQRRIDVDDLMSLAIALEVSPLALLLPHNGEIEGFDVTGSLDPVAANVLWLWCLGEEPFELPDVPGSSKANRETLLFQLRSKPEVEARSLTEAGVNADESELAKSVVNLAKLQRIKLRD